MTTINPQKLLEVLGDMLGEMELRMIERVAAETAAAEQRILLKIENQTLKARLARTTKADEDPEQ